MVIKDVLGNSCWNFGNKPIVLFTLVKTDLIWMSKDNFESKCRPKSFWEFTFLTGILLKNIFGWIFLVVFGWSSFSSEKPAYPFPLGFNHIANLTFSECFWNFNHMINLIFNETTVWNSEYYDNAGSSHLDKFCWIHVLKGYPKFCNISKGSFHLKLSFPNNLCFYFIYSDIGHLFSVLGF